MSDRIINQIFIGLPHQFSIFSTLFLIPFMQLVTVTTTRIHTKTLHTYVVGLGDIGIYCHDISWQKVSRYYYISLYCFSQPETNYTIEVIILVDTLIDSYTLILDEVYIQIFKQPFVIKSM